MTNLTPALTFDDVVEHPTTELLLAGPGGPLNRQAQQLLNRTQVLKQFQDDLIDAADPAKGSAKVGRNCVAVESMAALLTVPTPLAKHVSLASYHPGWAVTTYGPLGGSFWAWNASKPKSAHNGFDVTSPTVPWNGSFATLGAFQAGTGEAAPGTNGCWVRIHGANDIFSWGCIPFTGTNNFTPLSNAIAWAYNKKQKMKGNSGTFDYGSTLDLSYPTLVLRGNGFRNTIFKFTGAGRAMDAIGTRPNNGIYSFDIDLSDFTVEGNASATDLLRIRINHARLRDLNFREASTAGGCALRIEGCVAGHFTNITCSTNTQLMTSRPANGIVIGADPTLPGSPRATLNSLTHPVIEGMTGDGIVLVACDMLTVFGGTSENNGGNGVTENAGCQMNSFIGHDCESNLGFADFFIGGQSTALRNCGSTKYTYIDNSARMTRIEGGWFDKVEVAAGATGVELSKLKVRFFGGPTGLVTNNNPFLSVKDVFDVQANAFVFYSKPASVIGLTGSPQTYDNLNTTDETILINPNGGTITALAYRRAGASVGNMNPATGCIRIQPGDGFTATYTGSPIYIRVPNGTNYN